MARPLRLELAGALYHVTSRGDGREDIYLSDDDRQAWLETLAQVCGRFNWVCHAYCQMSNHYHLVIETPDANLSKGMRQLNGVYTQRFNRSHQRVGHVFQGRFKAILVEKDSYLLELARYVVLNPLRARMIRQLDQWPWSSYPATCGRVAKPDWLQTDFILSQFSAQRARDRQIQCLRSRRQGAAERVGATARTDLSWLGRVRRKDAGFNRPASCADRDSPRPTARPDAGAIRVRAAT